MSIERISDATDDRLADYRDLTDVALRRVLEPQGGLYIAESAKVIARALAAGHRPRSVLVQEKWLDEIQQLVTDASIPVYVVEPDIAESLTGYAVHRGALASMHRPELPPVAEVVADARLVVVLEDIVDHTNVGAILRNCAALGADAVLITPRCADPLYRRSVRVSMGAVFQVPWTRMDSWPGGIATLRQEGFKVLAAALREDAVSLDEFKRSSDAKLAIVLGSEGHGLADGTIAMSDHALQIPMANDVDSLNVSAASAVLLWALRR